MAFNPGHKHQNITIIQFCIYSVLYCLMIKIHESVFLAGYQDQHLGLLKCHITQSPECLSFFTRYCETNNFLQDLQTEGSSWKQMHEQQSFFLLLQGPYCKLCCLYTVPEQAKTKSASVITISSSLLHHVTLTFLSFFNFFCSNCSLFRKKDKKKTENRKFDFYK